MKGEWKYLYRTVDSQGNTLDFMLSARRDRRAAKRFFKKVLKARQNKQPRVINVDKNAAYPLAVEELKEKQVLNSESELRQVKYLNNRVELSSPRSKANNQSQRTDTSHFTQLGGQSEGLKLCT